MISFHVKTMLPLNLMNQGITFSFITVFSLHKMAFFKHSTTDQCKYQRNTPSCKNDLCKKNQ